MTENVRVFFVVAAIAIFVFSVSGAVTYSLFFAPLEEKPSLDSNITGRIEGICYYEGRAYGCLRNLTQMLNEEANSEDA